MHQSYFLQLFILGFYMPLIIHCLNVCCCFQIVYTLLNMTLFVKVEEFISLQSFVFVSIAVVELLDSTTICMSINNTLAEIVCCCFS